MEELKCKLTEYISIHSGKTMWGLDCDIDELFQEILKIQLYIQIKESLLTTNECDNIIPTNLIQKINSYIVSIGRNRNKTCRNCN